MYGRRDGADEQGRYWRQDLERSSEQLGKRPKFMHPNFLVGEKENVIDPRAIDVRIDGASEIEARRQ